ncbi:hypothetical protein PILCRDRAFT_11920 [Piloderma croceum F 1598]|uniref:Uncharacterized protein n=1 Tax=Piloderma croceum (strain F 1598) TaxID=765440 RepID=A0A0C3EYS3_PILCF|nr:hypothetical protein PILCRDRAFT_11920 [Piloderma croceum F 1598]
MPEGGILGHLRAFYGTGELTERANFHGHFLLWLVGRFFEFFEDIIHHHLPHDNDIKITSP